MADVVIMGAGPAGLTLGCYLAQADVPCLILERGHHPRPHVGESLMPASIRVLREIGFLPVMEAGHFPRSGGVVYHEKNGSSLPVAYGEFPQEGVDQPYTYHVDRAKFDMLLMKHAESLGCRIVEGAAVREVLFDEEDRATGVRVSFGSHEAQVAARVVVDAGGRSTTLGRQLGLRGTHPSLDQFALHAWFTGVDRGEERTARYTHVFLLPDVGGWAWMACIDDSITSIGMVASRDAHHDAGVDVETFLAQAIADHPALASAMRNAVRINDLKGEVNYSYQLDRVCGDGWLALGDAAQFIDPLFSSGVSVAMHGARFASERILAAVESESFGRSTFEPYERRLKAGSSVMDEFVQLFYRRPAGFTQLLLSEVHRTGALQLLQGDVGPASREILAAFRSAVESTEG